MKWKWRWVASGLFLAGVLLLGWAQTYGPGEIYYGGITLRFSGRLTTAGTCSPATQPARGVSQIQCQVPEGSAGTVELTATRSPAGAVNTSVVSLPAGWPSSLWTWDGTKWVDARASVASGWGTVTAQYRFTPPAGSAGRQFTLRFKAWTAGVIGELELRVILDVVRAVTPTPPPTEPTVPPTYGPFTGTTDGAGGFSVPIPTLPNTSVTGKLTECTVKPLPNTQVSVTLVPKAGVTTISRADQVGAVRVSSPGYPEVTVSELRLASSMDMWGRVYTTVDTGTVCLRPTAPPVTPPPTYGPISGKTDGDGKFTGTLAPGVTVTGRLTECTVKPLPNQEFTLTPVPKGEVIASPEDIAGFTFSVPGYAETTVTKFSMLSLFGLTSYSVGDVCLKHSPKSPRTDAWPKLTDDQQKAVKDLKDKGDRQGAIDKLVEILKNHCFDFGTMEGGKPSYDSGLKGEGAAQRKKGGKVWLGPDAFAQCVPWLYSSLMHELVHSHQWQNEKEAKKMGRKGREREAYKRELDNAPNTGISEENKKDLQERLKQWENPSLSPMLEFVISLPKLSFRLGEPIQLTMIVRNVSSQTLMVNQRLAVNDSEVPAPFRDVSLRIVHIQSGQEAQFAWDIRIGFPKPEDFAELAPGQTVQRTVDIALLYTLDRTGEYEVCGTYKNVMSGPAVFDPMTREFVERDIGAVKGQVNSNCLIFVIGGG